MRLAGIVLQPLGQAEVGDLRGAVARHQDVGRLEVAVDDSHRVGRAHRPGQQIDEPGRLFGRLRDAVDFAGQAAAVDVFQRKVGPTALFSDLINLHDVRVLDARDRLGLGAEAAQFLLAGVSAA